MLVFVDVERGERVDEKVCLAVVRISLDEDVLATGRFRLSRLILTTIAKVVRVLDDTAEVGGLEGELFRDHVSLYEVEGAHWPAWFADKEVDWVFI